MGVMAVSDLGASTQPRTRTARVEPAPDRRRYAVGELVTQKMLMLCTWCARLSVGAVTVAPSSPLTGEPHMTTTIGAPSTRLRFTGPAIEAEHLVKRFGDMTAVDDVSFTVPQGS